MPSVRIPPSHREPLTQLANMTADERSALLTALEGAAIFQSRSELSKRIADSVPHLEGSAAEEIIMALTVMYGQLQFHSWTIDGLVVGISESRDLDIESDSRAEFGRLLKSLLSSDSIVTYAKASVLLADYSNLFHGARIVTDIRPVFGAEDGRDPLGGIVTHTLRIDFFHEGDMQSFYVALDAADLNSLSKVLDRAKEKDVSVRRSILEPSRMPQFELEEDE
jgi:hypothetical protein